MVLTKGQNGLRPRVKMTQFPRVKMTQHIYYKRYIIKKKEKERKVFMTTVQKCIGYYEMYDSIDSSKVLTDSSKRLLCRYISYTKNKKEIENNKEKMAQWLGVSDTTIKRSIAQLRKLGYINIKHNISNDGRYKANTIQVNKEKINNDFGWHIFTDIKQSNIKENTNSNVSSLENRKNVCKFTETYSNAEQRRIRDELAKKRRDAKAEIN